MTVRKVITSLAALGLILAMCPATAFADTTGGGDPPAAGSKGGMTIEVVSVRLIAKVVVEVEVSVVCQPKPPSEDPIRSSWENTSIGLWAKQASGRRIAFGTTYSYFDGDAICDGTKHTMKVAAAADSSGVPFKLGTAAIAVAGDASYYWENLNECCSQWWVAASASTGWMSARLGK